MRITNDQADAAAAHAVSSLADRFGGSDVAATVEHHANAHKMAFTRVNVPAQHWTAVAKHLRFDLGVNYCSMVTGTHYPEGGDDRGWEVVYHLMRQPVLDQAPHTNTVHVAEELQGMDIPLEIEVVITLPQGETPTVPSVQGIWVGADWNEKETWDLVGIDFEGHVGMRRVLQPHETPVGFHPLQKQHKLRYHDFEEMYDDAQGFLRKPSDAGKIK